MRILLVNVDSRFNLAIRRMYNFFKKDNEVDMVDLHFSGYPHKKTKRIDATGYNRVYVSNIFDNNRDRVTVDGCDFVDFGGIGSKYPQKKLPTEIEQTDPFYFDDEDTAVGFITRGCIRNCWFCKVPLYEGGMKFYNTVDKIVGNRRKATFLDNNILAYEGCMEVFQWLIDRNIRCDFNQGLDFRLINDKNMELLSKLNYDGHYIFAFDDPKFERMLERKLAIMKKWIPNPWKFKFYIYYHPSMDMKQLFDRINWCGRNKCLPYVMRDRACWDAEQTIKEFLIDLTAYCNQPAFFKKQTFEQYIRNTRYPYKSPNDPRIINDLDIYNRYNEDEGSC